MSRIPQTPTRSPSSQKPPPRTPTSKSRAGSPSQNAITPRVRTKSTPKPSSHSSNVLRQNEPALPKPVDIREAIALKRAEAKKALNKIAGEDNINSFQSSEDIIVTNKEQDGDIVELGRWPLRETIERARNTGNR
jgi:hypothetical protein